MQYPEFVQSLSGVLQDFRSGEPQRCLQKTGVRERNKHMEPVFFGAQGSRIQTCTSFRDTAPGCSPTDAKPRWYKHSISCLCLVLVKIGQVPAKLMVPNDSCSLPPCKRTRSMIAWNWIWLQDNVVCKIRVLFNVFKINQTFF